MASPNRAAIVDCLRAKLGKVAAARGNDASQISEPDLVSDGEVADSAGLLELVACYDEAYGLNLQPEEMMVDNFGSLASMAAFALARMAAR